MKSKKSHASTPHSLLGILSLLILVSSTFLLTKLGPENFRNVLGASFSYKPNSTSSFQISTNTPRIDQLGKFEVNAKIAGSNYSGPVLVRYFLCSPNASSSTDPSCKYSETKWNFSLLEFKSGKVVTDFSQLALEGKYWAPAGKYFSTMQSLDRNGNPIGPQSNEFSYTIDPIDMTPYWNLEQSLSYLYTGKNYMVKNSQGQPSTSKVQIDVRPIVACGINYYGYTFAKSNPTGYFDPCTRSGACGDPKQANSGALNTNFYVAWVPNNEQGGQTYLASNLTNFVDSLGRYIPENISTPGKDLSNAFKVDNYDSPNSNTKRIFMRSSDNPKSNIGYNLGPKNLDLSKLNENIPVYVNRQEFYDFAPSWKLTPSQTDKVNLVCNLVNNYKSQPIPTSLASGGFHTTYIANFKYEQVSTPVYTGPAMRLSMREAVRCGSYADFVAKKCGPVLREDWYLAKNIGLVKIVQNYSNAYSFSSPSCKDDPDCVSVSAPVRSPEYEQVLIKYSKI